MVGIQEILLMLLAASLYALPIIALVYLLSRVRVLNGELRKLRTEMEQLRHDLERAEEIARRG